MAGIYFAFFESFYRQAEKIKDPGERLAFYDAIGRFAFDGEVSDLSAYPIADMGMEAVYPLVENSLKKINKGLESVSKRKYRPLKGTIESTIERSKQDTEDTFETERSKSKSKRVEESSKSKRVKDTLSAPAEPDIVRDVIFYLNEKAGTQYRASSEKTAELIKARASEGYDLEDFERVIDNKCRSWLPREEMRQYLRPETLFAKSHFESYLNELQPEPVVNDPDGFAELWDNI